MLIELVRHQFLCVFENVEQFTDNCAQALKADDRLWLDENMRRFKLEWWITSNMAVACSGWSGTVYEVAIEQLISRGVMTRSDVQAAWN